MKGVKRMECQLRKVVNYNKCKEFVDKRGVVRVAPTSNYYVRVNGKDICVKPCFANDYQKLDLLSEVIIIGDKNNKKLVG